MASTSNAPLKIPGNANTLLIWFGKSDRPVPTTFAPACLASLGLISGLGLAIAKIIGSSAIVFTISWVNISATDTPIKTSASLITSSSEPSTLSLFVHLATYVFVSFIPKFLPE